MSLPVKVTDELPVPVDVVAGKPIAGSEFRQFRTQTGRECAKYGIGAFTSDDDPFDKSFCPPVFGLYGVFDDGLLEHIADFDNYAGAVSLVSKLAPGILFPDTPHSR